MSTQEDLDLATDSIIVSTENQSDFTTETETTQPTTTQSDFTTETETIQTTTTQPDFTTETETIQTTSTQPDETETQPQHETPSEKSETSSEDSDDYLDMMYLVSIDNEPKFVFNSKKLAKKFMEIKAFEISDSCFSNDNSIQNIFVSSDTDNNYVISAYYKFMIVKYEVKLHTVSLCTVQKVV